MFEVKTRFRFSSEGGVGEKTRFGGGRFVIGTPSLPPYINIFSDTSPPSHKPFFISLPSHIPLYTTQKNRIDINQSYLKYNLIYLLN